jgi:RNA polymerase sigma-70 factor, ECF subfamily
VTSICVEIPCQSKAPERSTRKPVKDDAELLSNIRRGALDDFGELVRRHQGLIFSILHRYERDAHLLEDLAQETFVKAWRALDQFDGRAPFAHWLSRIAVHVALDHLRKRKRVKNEVGFEDLGEDALDWLAGGDEGLEMQASQAREILELVLQQLSPEERLVITLQELEGKSMKEICELTGWSNVAARVRAFRARNKMKKAWASMEQARQAGTSAWPDRKPI